VKLGAFFVASVTKFVGESAFSDESPEVSGHDLSRAAEAANEMRL
jgi:hypothetical protein